MGPTAYFLQKFLGFVELSQLAVDFGQLQVDLLVRVLFQQDQQTFQVVVEAFQVFQEQFLALDKQSAVVSPHAIAHEPIEEINQADVLVVAMQVVVGPPKESPQVDFFLWVVVAFFQKRLVVVDECQFAFVVGETDAKKAPSVPRVNLGFGFLVGNERLFRMLDPEIMAARGAKNHLLWRGDEVVVQHFAVGIQNGLVDHLGLQMTAF